MFLVDTSGHIHRRAVQIEQLFYVYSFMLIPIIFRYHKHHAHDVLKPHMLLALP